MDKQNPLLPSVWSCWIFYTRENAPSKPPDLAFKSHERVSGTSGFIVRPFFFFSDATLMCFETSTKLIIAVPLLLVRTWIEFMLLKQGWNWKKKEKKKGMTRKKINHCSYSEKHNSRTFSRENYPSYFLLFCSILGVKQPSNMSKNPVVNIINVAHLAALQNTGIDFSEGHHGAVI